jgi:tRNA modification GTPase
MRERIDDADTICAISTPPGHSAIGIIRVSGRQALPVVQALYGGGKLEYFQSHTAHYGEVVDPITQTVIDEALFLVMKGPRSYTGEDVVEIQSHGNPFLLQKILSLLVAQGAKLAMPGEFTRRAFLSGRIDLAQAEAVMEVIASQSAARHQWALGQLKGQLSQRINRLREGLLTIVAQIEASIDFSEEGITFCTNDEMRKQVTSVLNEVRHLLAQYEEGRQVRDGLTAVIVGRPNVGKSSLMNLLLQENRAIVAPIPGTTRDLLQEWTQIDGISVKVVDTAGYRETTDFVESEGVRRGEEALKKGDLALLVLDASEPLHPDDQILLERTNGEKRIVILNKSDLPPRINIGLVAEACPDTPIVSLCTINEKGLEAVKKTIKALLASNSERERPLVALVRHKDALLRAGSSLERAVQSLEAVASWEFLAADLREGTTALGEIVGEITTDAILDEIFNQFCIGK